MRHVTLLFFFLAIGISLPLEWTVANQSEAKNSSESSADEDLKNLPKDYRERVLEFRRLVRQKKGRTEKIQWAIAIAQNRSSKHRLDAINFLGEIQAQEALLPLVRMSKEEDVREFTLFSLGKIRNKKAMPVFIRYLADPSENVRGNAQIGIQNLTGQNFGYDYAAEEVERKQSIQKIERWWKREKHRFEPKVLTAQEKKDAEESWNRYGLQYLHDLER